MAVASPAWAATPCQAPAGAEVVCTEWTSRFDGAKDRAYVRLPRGFDPARPINVLIWLKAMGQGAEAEANPAVHALADELGVMTIGLRQRGARSFLGDSTSSRYRVSPGERLAAKQDVAELIDQLAARFRIGRVVVMGSSMGGYAALRIAQLFPERVAAVIANVPAICSGTRGTAPECDGSFVRAGSRELFRAAEAGAFDDKLVWMVTAGEDETRGLVAGQREFRRLMEGKPRFRAVEIAGGKHQNYLDDGEGGRWLTDGPPTVGLRSELVAFLAEPVSEMGVSEGWTEPGTEGREYLVKELRERGGKKAGSGSGSGSGSEWRLRGGLEMDAWEQGKSGPMWQRPAGACGCDVGGRERTPVGMVLLGLVFVLLLRRRWS